MVDQSGYMRYSGFRPRAVDAKYPDYAPERDMGNIGRWLTTVQHMAMTDQLGYWYGPGVEMGMSTDSREFGKEVGEAFLAVIEFLEQASGVPITGKFDPLSPGEMISFEDAMAKLMTSCAGGSQASLVVLTSMLGFFALDMLFFAARQDRLIGRQGLMTLDEVLPAIQRYGASVLSGEPHESNAINGLEEAVVFADMAGLSNGQIIRLVENKLVQLRRLG